MVKIGSTKITIMKRNLVVALTFIFATTFIGCSKDEDKSSTPSVVGKWRAEKFDYYTDGQFIETETIVEDNPSCPDNIEFKSNGTYIDIDNDVNCNSVVQDSGTYVFNGTTITYTAEGTSSIGTVISLTTTDMKIDFTETSLEGVVFKNVGYFKRIN